MKILLSIVMSFFLFACGSNVQNRATGVEHQQQLVIISDTLVGYTVSVGKIDNYKISSKDLTPYATGVAGAADAEDENRQILTIKMDKGSHHLVIKNTQGQTIYSKTIYFNDGQVRTIRI